MGKSYKEIKGMQKENKTVYYNLYRKFSTPFTYFFVKLGFSPSAVSILNFFPNIVGYFFLSNGAYNSIIIGLLFFILYKVLDCSDGEVARIQNENAMNPMHKKIEGPYFDAVGHFIEPICLGVGLGIGLFYLYKSSIYIAFGVFLAVIFTLEFSLSELVRSYFRKGIIERKIKLNKGLKEAQNQLMEKLNEGDSWQKQNIFQRVFGIYPFQGLLYSRELIVPILIFLASLEWYLSASLDMPLIKIYGQTIGILSLYLFIVSIVKLIKIAGFISKLKNNGHITNFLNDLQSGK